jgi:hypothetical protein
VGHAATRVPDEHSAPVSTQVLLDLVGERSK